MAKKREEELVRMGVSLNAGTNKDELKENAKTVGLIQEHVHVVCVFGVSFCCFGAFVRSRCRISLICTKVRLLCFTSDSFATPVCSAQTLVCPGR
jgi:hypothetical protein